MPELQDIHLRRFNDRTMNRRPNPPREDDSHSAEVAPAGDIDKAMQTRAKKRKLVAVDSGAADTTGASTKRRKVARMQTRGSTNFVQKRYNLRPRPNRG